MNSLFDESPQHLKLPMGDVWYFRHFIPPAELHKAYKTLYTEIAWQQDTIRVFGKEHLQPRLTALYGSNQEPYSYSNITMFPQSFTPYLQRVKEKVEALTGITFTTCLCNLYRDGKDSNGWHADDEASLGTNPIIVSVSLGATRNFKFRRVDNHKEQHSLLLEPGSLLLMKGATQHHWQHQLPKTSKSVAPRINLTFRIIV